MGLAVAAKDIATEIRHIKRHKVRFRCQQDASLEIFVDKKKRFEVA